MSCTSTGQNQDLEPKYKELPPIPNGMNRRLYKNPNDSRYNQMHGIDTAKLGEGWYCLCSSQFPRHTSLTEHIRYYTMEPKFFCALCPLRFIELSTLKRHYKSAHYLDPYPPNARGCMDCGELSQDLAAHKAHRLAMHQRWTARLRELPHAVDTTYMEQHVGEFRCICLRNFSKWTYLIHHVRSYTNSSNFKCEVCPSVFKTLASLNGHTRKVHKIETGKEIKFGCTICSNVLSSKKELQQHMLVEHGLINFNQPRASADTAIHHEVKVTRKSCKKEEQNSLIYSCVCGSEFEDRKRLLYHIQRSQTTIYLKCPHCSLVFSSNSKVKKHVLRYHKMPYSCYACRTCGNVWETRQELRYHIDTVHRGIVRN